MLTGARPQLNPQSAPQLPVATGFPQGLAPQQTGFIRGTAPWAPSEEEKKEYDRIFRLWDQGTGFISGQKALEVFGQTGLDKNDLARIWQVSIFPMRVSSHRRAAGRSPMVTIGEN